MLRTASLRSAGQFAASRRQASSLEQSYSALSVFFRAQEKQQEQRWRISQASLFSNTPRTAWRASHGHLRLSQRGYATSPTGSGERNETQTEEQNHSTASGSTREAAHTSDPSSSSNAPAHDMHAHVSSFPRSLRRLAMSLPSSNLRRPTKDE